MFYGLLEASLVVSHKGLIISNLAVPFYLADRYDDEITVYFPKCSTFSLCPPPSAPHLCKDPLLLW